MSYKGYGEVKVDIMLLIIANNCWTRSFAVGYWLYLISLVFLTQMRKKTLQVKDCLKRVCMLPFCPWPYWGQSIFVRRYIVSNQLIGGLIMVRHMKLILVLSLPLRAYYLMRCTHNALLGVIMNSFDSTRSYFGCVSCFWQDLQDLMLLYGMCIPFQYFTDFVVPLRLEWLGCWRQQWYQRINLTCQDAGMIKFHLYIALLCLQ